jgi:hypothetical protein
VLPFLNAKSSTPSTLTFPTSGSGAPLILLRGGVVRGHDAQLLGESSSRSAAEFEGDREQSFLEPIGLARAATSGSFSQKILLSHEGSSQKKRLARTLSVTEIPSQGRSETVRW